VKIAILDDYQNVALTSADWSAVESRADITVFNDHVADDELAARLEPFDAVCVMRERAPLPRRIIERLPRLKLIASTGAGNASIDYGATGERNIEVTVTGYSPTSTVELTWALIMASARNLVGECNSVRSGGWQTSIGRELDGQVLGVLGLGGIGSRIAAIGQMFGMEVIAWSQNLDAAKAEAAGATWVPKDELFARADILTIHLVLSERTRGLVGADQCARHEVHGLAGQHLTRSHRRRAFARRSLDGPVDRRSRARRVRHRTATRRPSAAPTAQRVGHPAHRGRRPEPLPDVLR
jgi:phosphoglycerate dehydrogenase-like enzyme